METILLKQACGPTGGNKVYIKYIKYQRKAFQAWTVILFFSDSSDLKTQTIIAITIIYLFAVFNTFLMYGQAVQTNAN